MNELKRYKEELTVIGLLSLVLLVVRVVSSTIWPTTGQYDLAAETETMFWTVLRVVIYSLAAWLGLRVMAPEAYKWLKHGMVDGFGSLTPEQKTSLSTRMYAIIFFGLVALALSGCGTASAAIHDHRTCVTEAAKADVGVREATGRNDGPAVERYLAHVGLGKGYAWCAAFVSYKLNECGVANPRSAWSPAFALPAARVWTPRKASRSPLPGDVFSLWYTTLKPARVGHVGFVTGVDGKYITTVEGNTSGPGSREGDGVYARRRELRKVYAITNYIPNETDHSGTTGATGASSLQAPEERTAQQRTTGQRGGALGAARYHRGGAQGQRGAAHHLAARRAGHACGTQLQRQFNGGAERGQRHCNGAVPVRQPGAGTEAVGTLVARELCTDGCDQGGRDHCADAQVGLVAAGHLHCTPGVRPAQVPAWACGPVETLHLINC
jgi:hypothetical protein